MSEATIDDDNQRITKVVKPPQFRQHRFNRSHSDNSEDQKNPKCKSIINAFAEFAAFPEAAVVAHFSSVVRSQLPQAKIVYVGSSKATMPPDVFNLGNAKPTEFPSELADTSHLFILAEDAEETVCVADQLLRSRSPAEGGIVVVALTGTTSVVDYAVVMANVSSLMRSGAHDVFNIPADAQQLHLAIAMSIAKAETTREHVAYLERKLCACRKQCDNLFWRIADEIVQDFPAVRLQLRERKGKSVGDINLDRKVGEGRSGTVHLWQDLVKGKNGAVKVLEKEKIKSVDEVVQIANEYFLMRRLNHRNVVGSTDFVHGPKNLYIFMEMAGTNNLFSIIRCEEGLPRVHIEELFLQIASGLAHCHEKKVAHCDLKPENIVISDSGCAKIVDFGEAVDLSQEIVPLRTPKGTMPFMSPEILYVSASWIPSAADVWALGVVLLEMMCGVGAFVDLVGWQKEALGATKEHADHLVAIFGEAVSNGDCGTTLLRIAEACQKSQSPAFRQLLSGMFELEPEKRLRAQSVIQHFQRGV